MKEEKLKILFWGGYTESGPGNAARSLGNLLAQKHTVCYVDQKLMRYVKFDPKVLHDVLFRDLPDVFHVHSLLDFVDISNIAQHGLVQYATPTILTVHGWNLRYMLPNRPLHSQFKDAMLHADIITVPSEQLQVKLRGEGFDEVYVCDNVVNEADFKEAHPNLIRQFKSQYGIPLNKPLIVSVGLFSPHKNPLCFFEAAKLLPKYHFLWVGAFSPCIENPGGMCKRCLDLIKTNENMQIIELPRQEMPLLYQGADLLFHPSKLDAQPMTILEAGICKLPVFASDAGNIPQMLGDAGVSLPQRKLNDYKAVADLIVNNVQSKKECAEKIYARIKKWCDPERVVQQYEAVYEKAKERQQ